jgi:hypothetical protein
MELTSLGSDAGEQQTGSVRSSWGWALKNKWAEHVQTKKGPALCCLFPGCMKTYATKAMTTSGINKHLTRAHRITEDSGVNDGSLSRSGPMDTFLHTAKQPRVFDPTTFDDLLVRFVVMTK